ncbi:MAG: hypothetical protein ACOYMA_17705 [Bacteroidia bacterium]
MKRIKENWESHTSTIIGGIVALATAWSTIDFTKFDINNDWKMLIIPAVIALGGYVTKINTKVN